MENVQRIDEHYMSIAIEEAEMAAAVGEIPVGGLIVLNGKVISRGGNSSIRNNDPTGHAEVVCLRKACRAIGNYRIPGATLYVTLEPCIMCVGSMIQARIERLVYGAVEPKTGAIESSFRMMDENCHNHRFEIRSGVLAESCKLLMTGFFASKR